MIMRPVRNNFSFTAHRRHFWLGSVIVIALGLIANILMGVRMDLRFTGGTVLRYSYPESGVVSGSEVVSPAVPPLLSDSEVVNTPSEPAELPVIISDSDAVSPTDEPEQTLSGADLPEENVSASDPPPESALPPELSQLTPDYSTAVQPDEAARLISDALGEPVTVQISTDARTPSGGENKRLIITLEKDLEISGDTDSLIKAVISAKYPNVRLTLRETTSVDPAVGEEFLGRCVVAVSLAVLLMLLYVGMRFRQIGGWVAAASAIIAIIHDCLAAYFAFVFFRFPISDHFIAVVLAIIGHSLNSTIVIFDRVRENRGLLGDSLSPSELADRSISESLGRTVSTDLCVFIAVAALAAVAALNDLSSALSFAVPMMFGVASGCYSSLCLSGTIWATCQEALAGRRPSPGRN